MTPIELEGRQIDLRGARWHASSQAGDRANSVEVAFVADVIAVRDSSHPDGPILVYTRAEWDAFIGGIKGGEFDR